MRQLLAPALATWLASTASAAPDGWLDVRDCGASGSRFETTAATTAGAKDIVVKDVGDFKVGQGVMVSKCHPRVTKQAIWGPRKVLGWEQKLDGKAEIRGYNGDQSDWLVVMLDVPQGSKTFRWTEDFARTWHPAVPITGDWQLLRDGIEVRFNAHDWERGYTVVFAARGQLVTTIEKVAGNVLTLRDAPTRSAPDAVLRHCDDAALQAAISRAIQERRHVRVPVGHYRLSRGLSVRDPAGLTIQGANAVHTVLDISEGEGACITLSNGIEATLRNLTMVGHSGFEARDQCGAISMRGSSYFWGFAAKNCNAVHISGTERVLIENCHGVRMASECFVSGCPSRGRTKANQYYSQAVTYLRCSATDCGRNAFNDVVCGPENTSVLYCRIVEVGGCSWEGASRFVRFIGNYVRNAGTVAMGNLGTYKRDETYPDLGPGQHIIADNVFESFVPYGSCAIRAAHGASQVIIRNNLFINFGSSAVEIMGASDHRHLPAGTATIIGNMFDMTSLAEKAVSRTAVDVSASDVLVSDNQVYVRGQCDPLVTAIRLREPAVNLAVHDNLLRTCGAGLTASRAASRITEVVDPTTFVAAGAVPLERRKSHLYRGWNLAWMGGSKPKTLWVIDAFDPETLRFKLRTPHEMKVGDSFEVCPPSANWKIHNNTISDCQRPVVLDVYGSESSSFSDNIVTRGGATGVKQAVEVHGAFKLTGNHFSGFDEQGSSALALYPDPIGRVCKSLYRGNIFERCAKVVAETQPGLWQASSADGNVFIGCGSAPKTGAAPPSRDQIAAVLVEGPKKLTLRVPKVTSAVAVDGSVTEWAWNDPSRASAIAQTPMGDPIPAHNGLLCAAHDDVHLYLAIRIPTAKGAKPVGGDGWGKGDGIEVSFQSAEPKAPSPIFLLWGSADGKFTPGPYGGATEAHLKTLQQATTYAARVSEAEWTCEWRIPLAAVGLSPSAVKKLLFNVGFHRASDDLWVGWVGTKAAPYHVDKAGELLLER